MLSHGVRRNLPKLLAALRSGLLLLRLGPGGSGGLPERTARFSTCYEFRDLPCRTRGGYLLATLLAGEPEGTSAQADWSLAKS